MPNPDQLLRDVCRKREAEAAVRRAAYAKARLAKTIQRKLTTTFIGALSRVEFYFGYLWGQGKSDEELTETERLWKERYESLRRDILDNGNTQARALRAELERYAVCDREDVG